MINDLDKKIAKQQFQLFDKILSIQNIFTRKSTQAQSDPTKRQEMRLRSKKNLEFAHVYVVGLVEDCTKREEDKADLEGKLEKVVKQIIQSTTLELMGLEQEDEDCVQAEAEIYYQQPKVIRAI